MWPSDGNWFWDGTKGNDAISVDGRWRFDGNDWQPFAGQRSPMPPPPFPPASSAPPPPPPAPAVAMPSWVAAAEVERIEREKRERDAAAARPPPPPPPPPPDRDLRQVGERMEYGNQPDYSRWQVGTTSVLIYVVLLWLCGPLSAVFVWMTRSSTTRKLITTAISLLGVFAVMVLVVAARLTHATG
jgi:hypothetical protein